MFFPGQLRFCIIPLFLSLTSADVLIIYTDIAFFRSSATRRVYSYYKYTSVLSFDDTNVSKQCVVSTRNCFVPVTVPSRFRYSVISVGGTPFRQQSTKLHLRTIQLSERGGGRGNDLISPLRYTRQNNRFKRQLLRAHI